MAITYLVKTFDLVPLLFDTRMLTSWQTDRKLLSYFLFLEFVKSDQSKTHQNQKPKFNRH